MKRSKLLLLAAALCCSVLSFAQTAATTVTIRLVASNDRNHELTLLQDNKFSADKQDRDELSILGPNYPNPAIFADVAYGKMTTLGVPALVGTEISFYTNQSTDYRLEFTGQTGEVLTLKDMKTNKEIKMVNGATYSFAIDANEVSSRETAKMVSKRFRVVTPTTPGPTDYEICYRNGYLEISNYPVAQNTNPIVVKDESGNEVKREVPVASYQSIDLRSLTPGHYTVEANGETLTIGVQ